MVTERFEIVSTNPYQLAKDIRGIGFISADIIARNLGIDKNSLIRAKAGLTHTLLEATSDGHCGLPKKILLQNIQKLLKIEQEIVERAIMEEVASNVLIIDTIDHIESIFLISYYIYEQNITKILVNLTKAPVTWSNIDTVSVLPSIEQELGITLATSQKQL
ncbi:helix-hairpin-helix domain-containing protein [Candidatus Rickettsia kedanie]|uniref:ATP-dependent RecD2 DNA helicase-like helix-hairpin-helix domain-containing protein n=1 Tax=Candidatus Rickettsia kedanie TaxID=3115352 RepID=A0ABP9TZ18_9RICK